MKEPEKQRGLSRLEIARGMRLWNLNGALEAVYTAITTGVYTIGYALHLGASSAMIGLISAAPSLGQILQAISPLLIERLQRRKPLILGSYSFGTLMWLPAAFIPFLFFEDIHAIMFMVFIMLSSAAMALGNPARSSWFTDLVPGEIRGRFVGRQHSIIAAVGLVTAISAGAFMDLYSGDGQQTGFSFLFIVAMIFSGMSLWSWSRTPEPPKQQNKSISSGKLLSLPFRHPQFRKFMFLVSGRLFIAQIAAPFFTVYMLRTLEISYSQIALFASLQILANIAMNPLWGYLSDKFGYRPIFLLATTGLAIFPLGWGFVTLDNYWIMVPIVQIWGGMMSAGIPISQFNLMVKIAPEANRSVYLGCYSALSCTGAALGAMIGGVAASICATLPSTSFLGQTITDLQYLFIGNFVLRLSWVAMLTRLSEDASASPREVINQMRRGNPITTLWHLVRMGKSTNPSVRARAARELGETGSHLAVDELISLLNDSERNVRREAVRSLGQIDNERAVLPLLECISDPTSDIAEEAVESLGAIHSSLSLNLLVTLLHDNRTSIRRSAVIALDRIGDSSASKALEVLLAYEEDQVIAMIAIEALSKMGNVHILPRMQQLLREGEAGLQRRTLTQSMGYLLDTPDLVYRLLQTEGMAQDREIVRVFRSARRRLSGWRILAPKEKEKLIDDLDDALLAFERQRFNTTLLRMLQIALRVFQVIDQHHENTPMEPKQHDLHEDTLPLAPLHLASHLLSDLQEQSRARELLPEERLIAVAAFQKIVDEAV